MNLADPELELIDPTPNIYSLFTHFDELFFCTTLIGRALVRWSKRMYSCAGTCSYEGKNGICDIALSEPLLKLRPRKDLIETLLHEMIHAYLFITNRDNDRDGHGPNFKAHMHRINREAGLNISIYHDFHDEVKSYLRHCWRCNGKCQKMRPYFGVVRRNTNKAPGPSDHWWVAHQRICGGTFIKIKEPEKIAKKSKKTDKGNINADITKYINNNNDNTADKNIIKPINKGRKTVVNGILDVKNKATTPSPVQNIWKTTSDRMQTNSNSVVEKVRDVWKNKLLPPSVTANVIATAKPIKPTNYINVHKHKADSVHVESPPKKIKKIDDYFKATASNILKDVYGGEFVLSQSNNNNKIIAVTVKDHSITKKQEPVTTSDDLVSCPSCNSKVSSKDINSHLDECLNKDIINSLSKEFITSSNKDNSKLREIVGEIQTIPKFKTKIGNGNVLNDSNIKIETPVDNYEGLNILKPGNENKRQTDFIIPKIEKDDPFSIKNIAGPSISKDNRIVTICPNCRVQIYKPIEIHLKDCLHVFDNNVKIPVKGTAETVVVINEFSTNIKSEPGSSKDDNFVQKCPCCGQKVDISIESHLDECLGFFDIDTTIPHDGSSTIETIVIDDDEDDEFDETQTLNATGTKSPCPCCLKMIEFADMNDHIDVCLTS